MCSETQYNLLKFVRVYSVELLGGSCALVSWLQLDVSVLRPPSPLLDAGLNVLRCLDLDLLVSLLKLRQQQLLGQVRSNSKEELGERKLVNLVQFGNLNKCRVKIMGD